MKNMALALVVLLSSTLASAADQGLMGTNIACTGTINHIVQRNNGQTDQTPVQETKRLTLDGNQDYVEGSTTLNASINGRLKRNITVSISNPSKSLVISTTVGNEVVSTDSGNGPTVATLTVGELRIDCSLM